MAYGYLGQNTPNQTVNNSGVFSITDSADLESQGSLGGSLELIEEQTTSGTPSAVNFTNLKGTKYDVHYLTATNTSTSTDDGRIGIRLSNDGGSSYESSNYQTAYQANAADGGVNEYRRAFSKSLFLKELQKMMPSLKMKDIVSGRSGVRAMALGIDGEVIDDFKIVKNRNNIHVLNAPSPAATSCLAIGDHIMEETITHFNL